MMLPVPIHNNQSSDIYTTYKLPKYKATAASKSQFIELPQNYYDLLTGHHMLRHKHYLPIRPTTQMPCARVIFIDTIDKIPSLCDSTLIVSNSIPKYFFPIQDKVYYVTRLIDDAPWLLSCDTLFPPPLQPCTLYV